jgi:hypothetical protein
MHIFLYTNFLFFLFFFFFFFQSFIWRPSRISVFNLGSIPSPFPNCITAKAICCHHVCIVFPCRVSVRF